METSAFVQEEPRIEAPIVSTAVAPAGARLWLPLLLLLCSALPFLFSLGNGFVYDDDVQIVHNSAIRTWHGVAAYIVPAIISRNAPTPINGNYYRPLFFLWLHVNYALFGLNSTAWHVASLLLHLGVTLLVFLLLRRHFPDSALQTPPSEAPHSPLAYSHETWIAAAGALLFAIHPAHIESVVWVSGATDTLAALGMLGSLLLWMPTEGSGGTRIDLKKSASLACFAAALLAKETAIVLPALIFVYAFLGIGFPASRPSGDSGRVWPALRKTIPYLAVAGLYFAARVAALHGFRSGTPWISTRQALLTIPRLLAFYLRHLLWPVNLSLFYDLQPVPRILSAAFLLPALLLVAVGVGAWLCWRGGMASGGQAWEDNLIPAAFAWLVIPLLPVLDIALFQREDFAHDRYLYLPVLGLAMLGATMLQSLEPVSWSGNPTGRRVFLFAVTLFFTILAASTAAQAQFWRDDLALYTHALQQSKNTGARNNLANLYARMGRTDEADAMLTSLVQEEPDSWLVNYNYGFVNYQKRRFDLAERYLRHAIALDPSDAGQYTYLGLTYLREGRPGDATTQLRLALARDPSAEGCHLALGFILEQMGDLQGAKAEFVQELKYHPSMVAANQLAHVYSAITANDAANPPANPKPPSH